MDIDKELDTCGLKRPYPILRTRMLVNQLVCGQVLKVVATDPGSMEDMEWFCRQTGHKLMQASLDSDTYTFVIRKV